MTKDKSFGQQATFGKTPIRRQSGSWPLVGALDPNQPNLIEATQNWLYAGGTWAQCQNHMEPFLKMEGVTGYADAFVKAGYQKQIEVKRGTWKLVEGTFTLWTNTYNEVLPAYAITTDGESGLVGIVYVDSMPDLLSALDQFRGMLSLFEGMATRQVAAG